jgi:hypothetical protein
MPVRHVRGPARRVVRRVTVSSPAFSARLRPTAREMEDAGSPWIVDVRRATQRRTRTTRAWGAARIRTAATRAATSAARASTTRRPACSVSLHRLPSAAPLSHARVANCVSARSGTPSAASLTPFVWTAAASVDAAEARPASPMAFAIPCPARADIPAPPCRTAAPTPAMRTAARRAGATPTATASRDSASEASARRRRERAQTSRFDVHALGA